MLRLLRAILIDDYRRHFVAASRQESIFAQHALCADILYNICGVTLYTPHTMRIHQEIIFRLACDATLLCYAAAATIYGELAIQARYVDGAMATLLLRAAAAATRRLMMRATRATVCRGLWHGAVAARHICRQPVCAARARAQYRQQARIERKITLFTLFAILLDFTRRAMASHARDIDLRAQPAQSASAARRCRAVPAPHAHADALDARQRDFAKHFHAQHAP